jgi:peptide deformylase
MILPVYVYGAPILRRKTDVVETDTAELQKLIDDMIQTMHGADGIGLAAPQVGRSEMVFVVDVSPLADELAAEGIIVPDQPMALINPEILYESPETDEFEEGCLSIPDIREMVARTVSIRVRYLDRNLEQKEIEASGLFARVILHEYDHLHGILFTDRISSFRKRLLRRRLREMAAGNVDADYPLAVATA